jgi:hypothetical protein
VSTFAKAYIRNYNYQSQSSTVYLLALPFNFEFSIPALIFPVHAGYSLFAVISAGAGGRLSDRFGSYTKTIVVVCIFTMALGNFQYVLGFSVWNILAARCLCGKYEKSIKGRLKLSRACIAMCIRHGRKISSLKKSQWNNSNGHLFYKAYISPPYSSNINFIKPLQLARLNFV